eukprot:121598_1
MADKKQNETGLPNEFTLNDDWKNIGTIVGTNGLIGAGVGLLVSLVLMRRRRSVLIGFSSGIGVGIGWRDSHATSQFLKFSNANFSEIRTSLPTLKDRFMDLTGSFSDSTTNESDSNK